MEELDVLKKDWNKINNYPRVSEQEIYAMLHKNSSSTVKWIFIISIIELSFGIVLGIIMSFTKFDAENIKLLKGLGIYDYYRFSNVVIYIVILYFITRFYIMYKRVSTTDNTKSLMNNILKTRRVVKNYILFNIITFAVLFISLGSYVFEKGMEKGFLENGGKANEISLSFHLISFGVFFIVATIFVGLFWLIYNLIYGRLLRKLNKNFNELKKIDL
ncbi:hypothetical protein [Flavobacterium humi]|uniref:Uncharacterized protein n=1 Tax=Flavobacterium humi TaxID=2562683 RepID=A0A4Z0LBJ5_9FLAO|nr:hypothetical protein [Flavobacterium humi]TGD59233.1 hypothetical protein E4635_05105 [Flavobacterium humi]